MKILGNFMVAIAYLQFIFCSAYYGILPAIGGSWSWGEYGVFLIVWVVIAVVLYGVGDWIRNRKKVTSEKT